MNHYLGPEASADQLTYEIYTRGHLFTYDIDASLCGDEPMRCVRCGVSDFDWNRRESCSGIPRVLRRHRLLARLKVRQRRRTKSAVIKTRL